MRPFEPALLRRLPASRAPVAVLSAAGVLVGAVSVAQAACLAWLAATVATGGGVGAPLAWTVGLLAVRGLLAGAQEWVAGWAGQQVASALRLRLLRRWATLPEGRRPTAEDAVTLAGEGVASVEPYVARYLPALVAGAVVPALTVLALLLVDPWSAAIVLLTLPLLPVFAILIGRHTADETRRRWSAMADLAGHFLDVVRGLPTLVAYGRARRQVTVVAEVGRRHRVATVRTLRTAFLSTAALELLATISVALVAVAVGLRLAYGSMELQVAMTAILLAPEAYWPLRRVGMEFHSAADGAEALERLLPELEATTGPADAPRGGVPAVRVSGLSYARPGRRSVLRDLDLSTASGPGLTALTGASGAGKTTLLELLAGLLEPGAGRVTAPPAHLATQRPLLLPGTVRDNLLLARPRADDPELRLALERVGLWPVLAEREGLDTRLGDDGFGLSAGQRGRLALARAVLSDAPLVLLDEPTAHVAAESVESVRRVVRDLARDRRVVVATHDRELASAADQQWRLPRPGPSEPRPPAAAAPGEGRRAGGVPPPEEPEGWVTRRVPERWRLRLAAGIGGLATASGVALTATSGWLIVQASYQPVVLTLMVAIVGVRAFGVARPVLRYAERVMSHDVALATLARERTRVYERLVPLTPARLGRRSRDDVLTAVVRDLDDVVDEQVRVFVPAVGTALASAVAAAILLPVSPAAGAALVAGTLASFAVGRLGQWGEQRAQRDAVAGRGAVRRLTGQLAAQLTPVRAVAGSAGAGMLVARLDGLQAEADRAVVRLSHVRGLALGATWLVVAACLAPVALAAAGAVRAGELSGPLAALVVLTPMALAEAWTGLSAVFGARARSAAARRRLAEVLDQSPAVVDRSDGSWSDGDWPDGPSGVPAVEAERVSARWRAEDATALPATDLAVAPGERVVLTGPNGCGKSTLLAVLARHLDPWSGRYAHDGHDVTGLDLERTRARFALVDDEPHAFAGSVRANLLLARPDAPDADLVAALAEVGLGDWLARHPDGLDSRLTGLSGGERTRLALARAVLSGRPVLLLDEPTAHLDAVSARVVLDVLGRVRPGTTTVLVSHDPALLRGGGWRAVRPGSAYAPGTTDVTPSRPVSHAGPAGSLGA